MGSSEILSQYNAAKAQLDGLNYDDILKAQKEKNAANKQKDIDTFSAGMDSQINNTQAVYNKGINDTKVEYENQYQKNAVQKLINEKQIAEKNANLGLTDSGLNRTQQTAVQLSYANQKGNIDLARQSRLDELGLSLTQAIAQLQNDKASGIRNIENNWDEYSAAQAQNIHNTQYNGYVEMLNNLGNQYNAALKVEADAAVEKAKIIASSNAVGKNTENASKKTLWYYTGSYDKNDNPIFRNSEGKTQAFGKGINPYTGTKHKDAKYGTFSNGYQPNNIGGKTLKVQSEYEVYVNGKKQSVWSYDNGKTLWAWDGSINEYVDVTSKKDELKK